MITRINPLSTDIHLVLYSRGYSLPIAHITHHTPAGTPVQMSRSRFLLQES